MESRFYIERVTLVNESKIAVEGWVIADNPSILLTLDGEKSYQTDFVNLYPREDVVEVFGVDSKYVRGFYCVFAKDLDVESEYALIIKDENGTIMGSQSIKPETVHEEEIMRCFDEVCYLKEESKIKMRGWAFAKYCKGITSIKVYLKNKLVFEFAADRVRSDVGGVFKKYPAAQTCGFSKLIDVDIDKNPSVLDVCFCSDNSNEEWMTVHVATKCKNGEIVKKYTLSDYISVGKRLLKGEITLQQFWSVCSAALKKIFCIKRELRSKHKAYSKEEVWLENNQYTCDMMKILEARANDRKVVAVFYTDEKREISSEYLKRFTNQNRFLHKVYVVTAESGSTKQDSLLKLKSDKVIVCSKKQLEKVLSKDKTNPVLLLDDKVVLEKFAIPELICFQQETQNDIVYSDSRLQNGSLYFKPDWSPEHLLSANYIGNCILVNPVTCLKILKAMDGLGRQYIYDFLLRAHEEKVSVGHVAKVLFTENKRDYELDCLDQKKVLEKCLARRKCDAVIQCNDFIKDTWQPVFTMQFPNEGPKVEIIIPTKNGRNLLERCVKSLEKTTYKNYSVTVIDNESDETLTLDYLHSIQEKGVNVLRIENEKNKGFSYSYINNEAAKKSKADYLLFLNNDVEVISDNWLSSMVGYAEQDCNVGVVGAKLLFPDDTIQHAGIIMGVNDGMAAPAFKLAALDEKKYMNYDRTTRNYSAVTAACMLVKRELFMAVDMFDDDKFSVAYNDLDFCMKVQEKANKRVVYVSDALLYHYEGATRGYVDRLEETVAFREKYKNYKDKYYNPNLSLENEQFEICTACTVDNGRLLRVPKIAVVLHNLNYEGAPLQMLEVIKGIIGRGYSNISIIASKDGNLRDYIKEEFDLSPHIIECDIKSVSSMSQYENIVMQYDEYIKAEGIDLIIGNTIECFFAIDAAHKAGINSIWAIHESVDPLQYYSGLDWKIQQRYLECYSYVYRLVFCAKATQIMYKSVDVKHAAVTIHNGVMFHEVEEYKKGLSKEDAKRKLGISVETNMILILGNTCERKGQIDFAKAIKVLKDRGELEKSVFYIVGGVEGEYLDNLRDYISANELENIIQLVMQTKETDLYYRACDIFVCASYNESYPRVILEAMAYDLPIVTTPVYGISEQVFEGINGFFFEPGNTEKMADKIAVLLKNQQIRSEFSQKASLALQYINSYEEMISKYVAIVDQAWNASYKE